jgi:hypothetical protein
LQAKIVHQVDAELVEGRGDLIVVVDFINRSYNAHVDSINRSCDADVKPKRALLFHSSTLLERLAAVRVVAQPDRQGQLGKAQALAFHPPPPTSLIATHTHTHTHTHTQTHI